MTTCSVKWCGNNSRTSSFKKNGITFHRFPKCPDRKSKWIEACSRDEGWFPSNNNVICSRHFSEDSFYYMKERRRVMGTAVPTLYLPVLTVPMETSSSPNVSGLGVNISKTSLISEPGPSSSTSIPASPKNIVQPPSNSTPTQKSETPHRKRKIQSSLIFARDLGGLIYPSRTVTKICKRCELVIRTYMKRDPQNQTLYYKDKLRLVTKTLQTFINEDIFPEIHRHQFDHESCNHVIELAKSVVEKYVDIRLLYLIKKTNPNAAIRRVYTKLVHFKNQ